MDAENTELKNDVSENNKTNADKNYNVVDKKTKKKKLIKKKIIIVVIVFLIIFTGIIPFIMVRTINWESRKGDEFDLKFNGELHLNNPGAGNSVMDSDLFDRYFYLNQYCIIVYGQGGVGIMQIQSITPSKLKLKFGREKIVFYNADKYPELHGTGYSSFMLDEQE